MRGGYCYVGHIKRGSETINTNGDVFVPQAVETNTIVEFSDLNDDPKRPGKFRTEFVKPVTDLVVRNERSIPDVIRDLNDQKSHYHINGKVIEFVDIQKAAENKPFIGLINNKRMQTNRRDDIVEMSNFFLKSTYACLESYGVDYSITNEVDLVEEESSIRKGIKKANDLRMKGLAESIDTQYKCFRAVRKSFHLMQKSGILKMDTIIPIEYLVDLFVVAPVWFVHSKVGLPDNMEEGDPEVDHAIRYFCDLVDTQEFAWLYQIYNRRTRSFNYFHSRDVMPVPILELYEVAKDTFDYVTICTPYHDIASEEWNDPSWMRNIDPYLVGFMKEVPFMFLLGRWSATGLFPMVLEMIADTMIHLKTNINNLKKFPGNSYWYKGRTNHDNQSTLLSGNNRNSNSVLVPFANEVLLAYEQGELLEYLKGRKPALEVEVK